MWFSLKRTNKGILCNMSSSSSIKAQQEHPNHHLFFLKKMSNYFLISLLTLSLFLVVTTIESAELFVPAGCPLPDHNLNYRPVIGIISHPGDGDSGRINNSTGVSYIAASYVKLVESGGARVIPLLFDDSPQLLNQVCHFICLLYLKPFTI